MRARRKIGIWGLLLGLILGCAILPAKAEAMGPIPIEKLLTTLSKTPVAAAPVNEINPATSTIGCYISSCAWYNVYGQTITDAFSQDAATVQLRVEALPGYYFAPGMAAYLNNEWVEYQAAADGSYAVLYRTYAPAVWAPAIIKHPGGETVDEGGWTSFVATASNVESSYWRLIDSKGDAYKSESLSRVFPGVSVDESLGKIKIYQIPREFDGAKISCVFTGPGGSVETQAATLKVRYEETEETPEEMPMPVETAEAEPMQQEEALIPEEEATHEHHYDNWQMDEEKHWKQCECGEISEKEAHQFEWVILREATKEEDGKMQGKCSRCGCVHRETILFEETETPGWFLYGGIGAAGFLILAAILSSSLRRRRRRNRRNGRHR